MMENLMEQAALAADKEALLALLLAEEGLSVPQADTITPREASEDVPLSFAQQRLWFLEQLEPNSPTYNIPNAVRLTGQLNVAALQQSLNAIVQRHEVLRTVFPTVAGRPAPVIFPATTVILPIVDLRTLPEPAQGRRTQQLLIQEARQPFDLGCGPLVRGRLLWLQAQVHVLVLTMHHIVSDAWSRSVLIREVVALYEAYSAGVVSLLPALPIQYADFAHWQRQWLQGDVLETQLAYWKQQLGTALPILEFSTDQPRPVVPTWQGARQAFVLPRALTAALRRLGQEHGVTSFMVLLAAFQILLQRYTGCNDITVGTPVANRTRLETEGIIGFFVNTLVLRTDLGGNPTFLELLQRVREVTLAAHTYQDVPFELLVDVLQPARDPGHTPLFQVMFVFQNAPQAAMTLPGLTLTPVPIDSGTAKFDLTMTVTEEGDALAGTLEYRTDLFDAMTITRLLGHWTTLLEGIMTDPRQRLGRAPLLTAAERHQLLVAWNATRSEATPGASLQALLEAQVARTPEAIALVCDAEAVTYHALHVRANRLAHYLRRRGVGPEVRVGVYLERSLDLVIGLLGILKAGGAYVPLDPAYPPARLAFILADSQTSVLLTHRHLRATLPAFQAEAICLDADWAAIAQESVASPAWNTPAEQLAYVLYTSGSTGQPKGVQIPHRAVGNFLQAMQQQPGLTADDVLLAVTTIAFDIAALEVFLPLSVGARVVLAGRATAADGQQLLHLLAASQATVMQATPATWRLLLAAGWQGGATFTVLCGGETLPRELAQPLLARTAGVWNLYGPTETTIWSAVARVAPAEGAVPIGRPIAQTQLYVLDRHVRPVPIGVPGELYIGGAGVARGYLNHPELTADRFLADPFSPAAGARFYKTGDRARYRADGSLEVLGRLDQQVKLRGFRIEPGEIEAVLRQHPAVQETVILAREAVPGDKRLVAYIVPAAQTVPTSGELRDFLQRRLPDYMVPAVFVTLDALPLNAHGKIDHQALPAPEMTRPVLANVFAAPCTPSEAILAAIWAEILRVEQVGRDDNFFALGGDSILSIQIIARAHQAGLRLTPRQVFQYQTIATLAAVAELTPPLQASQGTVIGQVSLTPVQHWFFAQHMVDAHHFNQTVLLQVQHHLGPVCIRQAMQPVLWQHDALRLRYQRTADGWLQEIIAPDVAVSCYHIDLSALATAEQSRVVEMVTRALHASLHLEDGPLLRMASLTLGEHTPDRVLLVIHHLAVDSVSWRILLTDLHLACEQLSRGEPVQLPPKTTSFKAWAERLRTHAQSAELRQELDYWRVRRAAPASCLPVDNARHSNTVASARHIMVALSPAETRALLQEVPQVYHTQINDVLLTALVQTLTPWIGTQALLLDLEGHGREALFEDIDLSRTVGWFTTIFPVLLELEPGASPEEALLAVAAQLRRIPNHGLGYGILRYLSQDEEIMSSLRALPQAEVCFNYLGQLDRALPAFQGFIIDQEASGLSQSQRHTRRYLLEINGGVISDHLQLRWTYSESAHRRDTIEALAHGCLEALRRLLAHCQSRAAAGYILADFTLAGLGQEQLAQAFGEVAFEGESV